MIQDTGLARPANSHDLDRVVCIYRHSFPQDGKSLLGPKACRRFFETVMASRDHAILVDQTAGEARAFAILQFGADAGVGRTWLLRSLPGVVLFVVTNPRALTKVVRGAMERLLASLRRMVGVRGPSGPSVSPRVAPDISDPPRREICYLYLIAVGPDLRGKGVGQLLVKDCMRRAAEAGCRFLYLTVKLNNASAIRLYEKAGFERISVDDTDHSAIYRQPVGDTKKT